MALQEDGVLELLVDNKESSLWASGRAKTTVALDCARCTIPFSYSLEAKVAFFAELKDETASAPPPEDDNVLMFTENDVELDLSTIVREELLINLPMMPVCRESCAGLCPQCGVDLNTGKCQCGQTAPDPRWEALLKLKKE